MDPVDALQIYADAARVLGLQPLRLAIREILRQQRESLRIALRKRVLIRADVAYNVRHGEVVAIWALDIELLPEAPVELV